jgi:putative inorganic carbon (hco3(-)) transporter
MTMYVLRPEGEWLVVLATSPILMYPDFFPQLAPAALILLVLPWLRNASSLPRVLGPLAWPIGLLIVMVVIGVAISPVVDSTSPKMLRLFLGIAAWRAVVVSIVSSRQLWRAVAVYLVLGTGLLGVGILDGGWPQRKFASLRALTPQLPAMRLHLPGAEETANANVLGAASLLFIPVAVAACAALSRASEKQWRPQFAVILSRRHVLLAAVACLAFFLSVCALSQSRAAWVSLLGTSAMLLCALPTGRIRTTATTIYAGVIVALVIGAGRGLIEIGLGSVEQRLELWSRAVNAIYDFPWTGVGVGGFQQLIHVMYPPFLFTEGAEIPHVHNLFLQTALDVGIPGLVAYLTVMLLAANMCWQLGQRAHDALSLVGLGLGGSLLGIHLFGSMDAIELGTRVGTFVWVALGILTAAHRLATTPQPHVSSAA